MITIQEHRLAKIQKHQAAADAQRVLLIADALKETLNLPARPEKFSVMWILREGDNLPLPLDLTVGDTTIDAGLEHRPGAEYSELRRLVAMTVSQDAPNISGGDLEFQVPKQAPDPEQGGVFVLLVTLNKDGHADLHLGVDSVSQTPRLHLDNTEITGDMLDNERLNDLSAAFEYELLYLHNYLSEGGSEHLQRLARVFGTPGMDALRDALSESFQND